MQEEFLQNEGSLSVVPKQNGHTFQKTLGGFLLTVIVIAIPVFAYFNSAPLNFPEGEIIKIEKGSSLGKVAEVLEEKKIIRSEKAFQILALIQNRDFTVMSGTYLFDRRIPLLSVLARVNRGIYGDVYARITIPEGSSNAQIAEILDASKIENFDPKKFMEIVGGKEGYLFPDTYFFFPDATEAIIAEAMLETFDEKIEPYLLDIEKSGRSLSEIINMASIVEKEANTGAQYGDEAKIVAGILWKRIRIGMALQVDAPFLYFLGKGSGELTRKDLETNSSYNTYINKGLPPTPIGNPGLGAIIATLYPVESNYLFYLHDSNGGIHYAVTNAGHNANKAQYLR